MKIILIFIFCAICMQSCIFDKPHKDVNTYYTSKYWGERRPRIPLLKPLAIYKDRMTPNKWKIEYDDIINNDYDFSFKHTLGIDSIIDIGVDKSYVYGKIFEQKDYNEKYNKDDYVFVDKYNLVYKTSEYREVTDDKIRIYPIDSVNKIFLLPERWFIINVVDSTTEAFFSKSKYENYLKERGISRRMYNIDSINTVYKETGILPWFPDSIKVKLRNTKR